MTATHLPPALAARRWGVIAAATLSGILVMVSMFIDPVPSANGRELIEGYAENSVRAGLHTNLIHYGFALLAPVVFAIVGLVRGRGAALANVAGVTAVIGLTTLPGLVMLDLTGTAAAQVTDVDTAYAIEEQLGQNPAFVFLVIPAFLCVMVVVPLAVIAMWRARLVHGSFAVSGVLAAAALHVAPTWWLAFGINLVWMMALGYVLWRLPLSLWDRGPAPAEPATVPLATGV